MKKRTGLLLALPFALLACNNEGTDSVAQADSTNLAKMDSTNSAGQPAITASAETSSFLVNAADGGMTEVQLGQIAEQKALNTKVKGFGAMMVHDHTAAGEQVKTLASQRNVTLPDSVSNDHKDDINNIMKKTGKAFDKAFIDAMVSDHKKVISLFEGASKNVNDTEVKTFVDNTLPRLHMHLDSAQAIQKMLK